MGTRTASWSINRTRVLLALSLLSPVAVVSATQQPVSAGNPTVLGFGKVFAPDTIGPGSTSTLTFTIDNSDSASLATDIAFDDFLPAGIALASPPRAATTCTDGVVTLGDDPDSVSLAAAKLGAFETCTVTVDVIGTATATNVSEPLTYNGSGPEPPSAVATLTVDPARPGFTKSFSPGTISLGHTSTLTFTIDNSAQGSVGHAPLQFVDALPTGMVVATPANASTDCGTPVLPPTFAPAPGASSISFFANGVLPSFPAIAAGATCTVNVDVTTEDAGSYTNASGELTSPSSSGFASARLDVPVEFLVKTYTDDPVAPGGSVTLQFTITNLDRNFPATGIAFDDPIDASLSGLAPDEVLPKAACGGTLDFAAGVLSLSGASLPEAGACTFTVSLAVPAAVDAGSYTNTTGAITATVDGAPVEGNTASDDLIVSTVPLLTKEFVDDPAGAGGSTTLRFTITNIDPDSTLTDIAFTDNLGADLGLGNEPALPGLAANPPLPDTSSCGGSSSLTGTTNLSFTDGSLAPAGDAGDSCSFDVVLSIPAGTPDGAYTNTSSVLSALVGGEVPVEGPAASDDLVVVGAPKIVKEFTDDPALPGGTATLEFTITHGDFAPGAATGITFTDDLDGVLGGLAATGLPADDVCGAGSQLSGTEVLTLTGGNLAVGESCTFTVTLDVPAQANAGSYPNATSNISATVDGVGVVGNPATDDLRVAGVTLTKEFTDDPVLPGRRATLRFTLDNLNPNDDAANIFFTDDLDAALDGLVAEGPLPDTTSCGDSSAVSGTSLLVFTEGVLAAGTSCFFDVTVRVPATTPSGDYINTTSIVSATMNDASFVGDPATDRLTVETPLPPLLTKTFTDDPVAPGDPVTLEFEITNPNGKDTLYSIGFTDELAGVLSGLTAAVPPVPDPPCGDGSSVALSAGDTLITFADGELAPGESCRFSLTLTVPGTAGGGSYPNTTSPISAEYDSCGDGCLDPVDGAAASDSLVVTGLLPTFGKSFTDDPVIPGTPVTLEFTIDNSGSTDDAIGLGFTDDLDAVVPGLVASGLPASDVCGAGSTLTGTSVLTLSGGNLDAGETCTFSVTLDVPTSASAGAFTNTTGELFDSGVPVAASASDDLVVELPDISVTKDDGVTAAVPGQDTITYTIVVTNNGGATVEGVDVDDTFPTDLDCTYSSVAAGGATGNDDSGTLAIDNTLSMPPRSSVTYTVTCAIDPAATGTLANTVTAIPPVMDTSPGDNTATDDDTELTPEADLAITKTDSVDPVVAGQDLAYTVTVTNNGPSDAANVAVTDTLPAGTTIVATNGCAEDPGGTPTCTLGTIPAGGNDSYTITVTTDADLANGTTLTNTATVTSDTTLTNTEDDTVEETTSVVTEADLSITKTDSVDPVLAGEPLTYTVTVTNNGPSDAANVAVTDTLPAGTTIVATNGCAEDPGGTPTCTLGTIPAGGNDSYTITVTTDADLANGTTLTNTATVTSDTTLTNTEDDTVEETTSVVTEADLSITKTDAEDPVPPGGAILYTITVDNAGPNTARNVVVDDTLPGGVTLVETAGCADDPSGVPTCSLGDIAAGGSASYTIAVTVDAGTPTGVLTNTATVSSDTPDPTDCPVDQNPLELCPPDNNTATEDTTVDTLVVRLEKSTNGVDADAAPGPDIDVGTPVNWKYVVSNIGTEAIFDLAVTDDQLGPIACPATRLEPGGSITCSATGDATVGPYSNLGTVTARAADFDTTSDDDPSHYVGVYPAFGVDIQKTPDLQVIDPGETASFTIRVQNTSAAATADVRVDDPLAPDCDLAPLTLGPTEIFEYSCERTNVTSGFVNVATASADFGDGIVLTDDDTAAVGVQKTLELSKTPSTQAVPQGGVATWTIRVTNNDTVPMTAVVVDDPAAPDCNRAVGTIPPLGFFSYTCTKADIAADFTNVATATGSVGEDLYGDTATADVVVVPPGLTISKTPDEQTIDPGDTASWTITVGNDGAATLSDVTVTDPQAPDCDNTIGDLAPGGEVSFTCERTGVSGSFTNIATVTGTDPGLPDPLSASDTADVIVRQPVVDIQKNPSTQDVAPGGTATFTIIVTNTGRDPLTGVAVTDPLTPDCDNTIGDLAPGEIETYTCELTGVTDDFTNTATATATADDGTPEPVTVSDTADVNVTGPSISIDKTPDAQVIAAGGSATFVITVENTGDEALTGVEVTDPLAANCDNVLGNLAVEQIVSYSCTLDDVTASFTNTANVSGSAGDGTVTDDDTAEVIVGTSSIGLSKTPAIQSIATGGTAEWTIRVTNTSRVVLTDVTVSDPLAPDCSRNVGDLGALAFFSYTCTLSGVTTDLTNVATVTASDGIGTVGATASADVVVGAAGLEISKTPDTQTIDSGDDATFTITVANTGTVALTGVTVTDPRTPDCDNTIGDLAAGDSVDYTCDATDVTDAFTNIATVTGLDPTSVELTDTDQADVIVRQPVLDIQKQPSRQDVTPGGTATFTIIVTNTGRDPVTAIEVTDPLTPDCDATIGTLAAGSTETYTCELTGVDDDFVNVATVTGTDAASQPVTASDDAEVNVTGPDISIVKSPDSQTIAYGGSATFTITVENNGDEALTGVEVTDALAPDCDRSIGGLAVEAIVEYSCTLSVVTESFVNIASVSATAGTATVGDESSAEVIVVTTAFLTVTGQRFADTRDPGGTTFDGQFAADGRLSAGSTYEVTIAGRGAIPANAVGVIANIASVDASDPGFFTVHPCEPSLPIASALNYTTGIDVSNEIFVKLSPTGSMCVYTHAETDLLIDVVGYVLPDHATKLVTPARVAESREGATTVDGLMEGFGRLAAGSTTAVQITGRANVPDGTTTAILNVGAVDPTADSFLTVFPCDPVVPTASSLNWATSGVNRANELIAGLDADGQVCIYTDQDIDLIVDVVGYIEPGSNLVNNGPSRFVETRDGATTIDGLYEGGGPLAAGSTTTVQIGGRDGIAADAIAAVVNVGAVDPLAAGYLTVTGCVSPLPNASSLNFTTGVNGANEIVVELNEDGELCVFTSASTDLILDVVGYLNPVPPL